MTSNRKIRWSTPVPGSTFAAAGQWYNGTVLDEHHRNISGTRHTLVSVRLDDGSRSLVDLGPSSLLPRKLDIDNGELVALAQKIAQVKEDYRNVHGEDLSDVDAIKQLPDEDRILAENMFRNIADPRDVLMNRYVAELERNQARLERELVMARVQGPTSTSPVAQASQGLSGPRPAGLGVLAVAGESGAGAPPPPPRAYDRPMPPSYGR